VSPWRSLRAEVADVTRRGRSRPNILLINCDDLGYGDLGCYGSTKNATPVLDGLAASGMRFTSFYMASPVCSPSRAALLTGCYPPRIGFGSFDGLPVLFPGQGLGLPDTEETLAAVLSRSGYRTQMVGKWHCGDQPDFLPTRHGFNHYFGLPYSNDMGRQRNPPSILDWLPPLPLLADDTVIEQQPDQASLTERYVDECVRFLRADDERPFFLYLAHLYVHLPIYVTPEALATSSNGPYGAAVGAIDWATGVLLEVLDELEMRENTIVLFTSDNGSLGDAPPPWGSSTSIGGSNLPLRGAKGSTWEGGLRVPAIVSWPGTVPPGAVNDDLHTSLDLFPTLAALADAPTTAGLAIDGVDVSSCWLDGSATPVSTFAYYRQNSLEAVRNERFKLHFAKGSDPFSALFDLSDDPGETTDVAEDHPDVVASLTHAAEDYRLRLGDERLGITGAECRPIGRVVDPKPLTTYDVNHPYVVAEYDLSDKG
jgi:arylsulfatase A